MPTTLADLLDPTQIAMQLNARNQNGALREIVQLLAANARISNPEEFLGKLFAREELRPSVVKHGAVFPHLRTDLVNEIVLGIGRSSSGISFANDTAKLIFLIGVPQRLASEYLVIVGGLARLLQNDEIRRELLHAKTAEQLITELRPKR